MSRPALRCAACGAEVGAHLPWVFRCPKDAGDRHHVLHRVLRPRPVAPLDDPDPFVAYAPFMLWWELAAAHGMPESDRLELVRDLDRAVAAIDGHGFRVTPFGRSAALSAALGFTDRGGVWVKDETGNVSGSHKARHLMSTMLHLLVVERLGIAPRPGRPRLAIASCGNAALGAAVVARAAQWPLQVFVPPQADPWVVGRLRALDAEVVFCPRRPGDPPGDPCVHRFRSAVDGGDLPFSVQGPENTYALDGGRTVGWELHDGAATGIDRVFVQVGGGALATGVAQGLEEVAAGWRLHAVQAAGCAPLARAWDRMRALGLGPQAAAARWDDCMWAWEREPTSVATGILDDETYDWLGVVEGMARTGGWPVVVDEHQLLEANRLVREVAGIDADHTGSAALAGLLALRPRIGDDERVAVLVTGARRG